MTTSPPPTADLRAQYLRARVTAATPGDALERVCEAAADHGLDPDDVALRARDGDWEGEYVRTRLLVPPTVDQDPVGGLAADVQRLRAAALDAHERSASGNASEWVQVERLYQDARKQYADERLRAERLDQDKKDADEWQVDVQALEARLREAYAGRGIQYEVLCMGLAPLVVKLNRSYHGGIRLTTDEQTNLSRTVTGMIAQLQKHTETTKTESTQVIRAAVVQVLRVIEPHLVGQPQTWQRILSDVDGEFREVKSLPEG